MGIMRRVLLSLLAFLLIASSVNAKQGCCSWHGGVSYCDTSVGRYVCSDGTYSPSCDCSYVPAILPPPSATPTLLPIKTNVEFISNKNSTYNVFFEWKNLYSRPYSIAISKKSFADPGAIAVTEYNHYLFKNITSGVWYVNLKYDQEGNWSPILSWKVNVPPWLSPTTHPTSEITVILNPTAIPTIIHANIQENNDSYASYILVGFIALIVMATVTKTNYIRHRLKKHHKEKARS